MYVTFQACLSAHSSVYLKSFDATSGAGRLTTVWTWISCATAFSSVPTDRTRRTAVSISALLIVFL